MWFEDPDLCFGTARNNRVEGPTSRYIESHIFKKLNDVLDNLVEDSLRVFALGSNDKQYGGSFTRSRSVKSKDKFCKRFADIEPSEFDFSKHEETRTIIFNEFDVDVEEPRIGVRGVVKHKQH